MTAPPTASGATLVRHLDGAAAAGFAARLRLAHAVDALHRHGRDVRLELGVAGGAASAEAWRFAELGGVELVASDEVPDATTWLADGDVAVVSPEGAVSSADEATSLAAGLADHGAVLLAHGPSDWPTAAVLRRTGAAAVVDVASVGALTVTLGALAASDDQRGRLLGRAAARLDGRTAARWLEEVDRALRQPPVPQLRMPTAESVVVEAMLEVDRDPADALEAWSATAAAVLAHLRRGGGTPLRLEDAQDVVDDVARGPHVWALARLQVVDHAVVARQQEELLARAGPGATRAHASAASAVRRVHRMLQAMAEPLAAHPDLGPPQQRGGGPVGAATERGSARSTPARRAGADAIADEHARLLRRIEELESSTSWRVTRPLRAVATWGRDRRSGR